MKGECVVKGGGRYPQDPEADTTPTLETATEVGGTHRTGMNSCEILHSYLRFLKFLFSTIGHSQHHELLMRI